MDRTSETSRGGIEMHVVIRRSRIDILPGYAGVSSPIFIRGMGRVGASYTGFGMVSDTAFLAACTFGSVTILWCDCMLD